MQMTMNTVPDKVTMLKVVERASHHIKLSWMAPAEINGEAKGYIIEYKENIDRATSLKTVITDPSQTYKKLYNLKSYTEYVFSVWTLNGAGQSSEANTLVESTTTPSVPDEPMILDIKSGSDYANVSWSPSIKEQKNPGKEFMVEYRKEGDSLWQNTKEEPEHNWYNVTDLEFGVKYEFRVVALNHDGDAMKSAVEEHVIGIHPETLASKSSYLSWFIPLLVIFLVILIIVLIIVSCLLYKRNRGGNYKVYEKEKLHGVKYDEEATFDEYIRSENSTFRKSKQGSLEGSNKSGSEDDDGSDSLGAYEDVDPTKFNDDGSFVDSVKNTNTLDVDLINFKNSINMK
ncbi:hypothetical protein HELRODRAFT_161528 [Helobdella robusta]|uniref:Fibronectin type-III domain-containing protein n=1 Tax=Helobdella robusta TaxID=6412 RepID=T1ERL3_HELRO|nr:hypothetical protein HELRODRAFT_161528 [Helobdella robusta]ESO02277.1 hypothetical protein HELRODRAFT_161528 [Helobdella robusta]